MIFYEAARRLGETLAEMAQVFGVERARRRRARNHQDLRRSDSRPAVATGGTLSDANQALGEIVIIVEGANENEAAASSSMDALTVEDLIEAGLSLKQASALIAKLTGASRRELYQEALKHRRETE